MSKPYDVDQVQTKFMVIKNFYVYREQFLLILAYAVTVQKRQGLSLDCAIVDLSDKVFSAGMAYVALSRVRSLAGLHLSAFDPKSIERSIQERSPAVSNAIPAVRVRNVSSLAITRLILLKG